MSEMEDVKKTATGLIKGLISLLEGYKELLKAGFAYSQPTFWSAMASEDVRVIGSIFKAIAIVSSSLQSMPKKISDVENLEKARMIIEDGINKLKALLVELGGE